MKITMSGMTFESNESDAFESQVEQMKLFLESVERIEKTKLTIVPWPGPSTPSPMQPWPSYPMFGPYCVQGDTKR